LSRERPLFPGADVVLLTEGKTHGRDIASARMTGVVVDTGMCERGNREISRLTSG
jgi:hypothetical protein